MKIQPNIQKANFRGNLQLNVSSGIRHCIPNERLDEFTEIVKRYIGRPNDPVNISISSNQQPVLSNIDVNKTVQNYLLKVTADLYNTGMKTYQAIQIPCQPVSSSTLIDVPKTIGETINNLWHESTKLLEEKTKQLRDTPLAEFSITNKKVWEDYKNKNCTSTYSHLVNMHFIADIAHKIEQELSAEYPSYTYLTETVPILLNKAKDKLVKSGKYNLSELNIEEINEILTKAWKYGSYYAHELNVRMYIKSHPFEIKEQNKWDDFVEINVKTPLGVKTLMYMVEFASRAEGIIKNKPALWRYNAGQKAYNAVFTDIIKQLEQEGNYKDLAPNIKNYALETLNEIWKFGTKTSIDITPIIECTKSAS